MIRTAIVGASLILFSALPVSIGAHRISLSKESALAAADLTPLPPQTGADTPEASSTDLQDTASSTDDTAAPYATDSSPTIVNAPAPKTTSKKISPPVDPGHPVSLSIPYLALSDKIVSVGVNNKGEMDVPSGSTLNVGWYGGGTTPGDQGSAVLDAHVFAAFRKLRYLKVGGDIFVTMSTGKKLHFVVTDSRVYALADVPLDLLFNRDDGNYVNLITCAGHLTPDHSTYDHRLIVYAKLVQ